MIATLQKASMKDCVGHAGMLSAAGFVCGTSFVNFSIWKWEKELERLLQTPGTGT